MQPEYIVIALLAVIVVRNFIKDRSDGRSVFGGTKDTRQRPR